MRALRLLLTVAMLGLIVLSVQVNAAEPVKVTFLFRGGALQEQQVNYWIAEFEKNNPDINVEWQPAPSGWMNSMPVWVAAGSAPDVTEMWGSMARDWGEQGVLIDLEPYVKRDYSRAEVNDFFPVSWSAGVIGYGPRIGMRFGMPAHGNLFTIYYNKTDFADAGIPSIPELDRTGQWTWQGLINFGKKLLKYDGTTVTRYPLLDDGLVNIAGKGASWIAANGGKLFDLPSNPTKFMMDQPETLGALQYLQDLIWQHKLVPNADDYAKYDFRKGTASMYMDGTGALARHIAAIGSTFEFDLARRPVGKVNRGYLLASDMWGITSSCKNKDAAWRFVKYLASRESAEAYGRIMGRGPVRRSAFPAFRDAYRGYNIDVHAEAMSEAIISPDTFMYKTSQANSLINTAAKEIRGNVKDPKTAIGGIVDAMRALYQ